MWVSVEVLVENLSGGVIKVPGNGELESSSGYRFHSQHINLGDDNACDPPIGPYFGTSDVKPGGKIRGWLQPFRVPVAVGALKAHIDLFFEAHPQRTDGVELKVGRLADQR